MKKLALFALLVSLTMFSFGCQKAEKKADMPAAEPAAGGDAGGGDAGAEKAPE
jgi:hypothetical protein